MAVTRFKMSPVLPSNKIKVYQPIFPNQNTPMPISISVGATGDYIGNIKATIVYWDNGKKIIINDYIGGSSKTEFNFTINNPTSIPPFIMYLDSGISTAVDIEVDYAFPLNFGRLSEHDYNLLVPESDASASLNFGEIYDFNPNFNPKTIKDLFDESELIKSPLVLDLDGDGVETTGLGSNVFFDHDKNGFAENSGWVKGDDGILVRDINQNGKIDDGSELFGNNSVLSSGQKADNGFEALKDLDSNNDGIFDANDNAWNEVKVWKDTNQNGKLDDGELLSLEDAGVSSINLGYINQQLQDEHGNQHLQTGTFIDSNGNVQKITDVWFNTDMSNTKNDIDIEIPDDIKALPNISGSGNVYDLHTAMALDTTGTLKGLVEQFIAETDQSAKKEILLNIIYHWTGVQDMDPNSRFPNMYNSNVLGDARKLEALEEFMGREYLGTWCWGERDPNPHGSAAPYLLRAFDELCEFVENQIYFQATYKPYFENIIISHDIINNTISYDVSVAIEMLRDVYQNNIELGSKYIKDLGDTIRTYPEIGEAIIDEFRNYGNNTGSLFENALLDFGKSSFIGSDNSETFKGAEFEDIIYGNGGNDKIYGNEGNDQLFGGNGNDTIFGDDGDDFIVGGAGDDYLTGGNGSDIYYFEQGFGQDSIYNNSDDEKGTNPDKIIFGEGINPQDMTIERNGFDLILKTPSGDSIRIYSFFDQSGETSATVDTIEFADGTIWNYNHIITVWNSSPSAGGGKILDGTTGVDQLMGTSYDDILIGHKGDDRLYGYGGNDMISGGKGNDYLAGGYGDDTYYYTLGDGVDTIYDEGNNDKLVFGPGINFSNLTFRSDNSDLHIVVNGDENQRVIIKNCLGYGSNKIEFLVFHSGHTVPLSEIGLTLQQNDTNEYVYGTLYNDTIFGNGGNDNIYAETGNDTVYGGAGDDKIYAGEGDDILVGGTGDDLLSGSNGADTYIWNLGDGFDTIEDSNYSSTNHLEDKIIFGAGISFSDLSFKSDSNHLYIYVNGDQTQGMMIKSQFSMNSRIEKLQFADGMQIDLNTASLTYKQTDAAETIYVGEGNNIIYAEGGDDKIYTYNNSGNNTVYGGDGNDNINTGGGNDTLIGGTGDDLLSGSNGADTYIWNLGDGFDTIEDSNYSSTNHLEDKIIFGAGISFSDLSFKSDSNHLYIYVNGDQTQGMMIKSQFSMNSRIEKLQFADGSIVDLNTASLTYKQTDAAETIYVGEGNNIIYAEGGDDKIYTYNNSGNNTVYGGDGNDNINTGGGNDTLIGGAGDDSIYGGYGNNTYIYNLGDDFDTLSENGGDDKIIFGEGISFEDLSFAQNGSNLDIMINNDSSQGMKIKNYNSINSSIEKLEFADGKTYSFVGGQYRADQLIQSMASFGVSVSSTTDMSIEELSILDNVIASSCKNVA